jgi:hypothetical protein
MESPITISDLYEGAFLLCMGCNLRRVTVIGNNGKKLCTFTFEGKGAQRASDDYRQGRATANVALLKFTMEKLKDVMFEKIREHEKKERAFGKEIETCSASVRSRRQREKTLSKT